MSTDEDRILAIFEGFRQILEGVDPIPFKKIAISVFDRWLGEKNRYKLNCDGPEERDERNRKLLSLCEHIFCHTEVYTLRDRKLDFALPVLKKYTEKASYLRDCAWDCQKTSDKFHFLMLPEFQAIYHEQWDDTNVLWYRDEKKIGPLLEWARISGLYILEYAV